MSNLFQRLAERYPKATARDRIAVDKLEDWLGNITDGEITPEVLDRTWNRVSENALRKNIAYPYAVGGNGIPWRDIYIRPDEDYWAVKSKYLEDIGLGNIATDAIEARPYYGPYRDDYITISKGDAAEVAAPDIAYDNSARAEEEMANVKDTDEWRKKQHKWHEDLCSGKSMVGSSAFNKCVSDMDNDSEEELQKTLKAIENYKKNAAAFSVTPEQVTADPLMHTENPRPEIQRIIHRLLTGED